MKYESHSQINIIVGENGSGKSTIISELAAGCIEKDKNASVICISNTPNSKFRKLRRNNYHELKLSSKSLNNSLKEMVLLSFFKAESKKNTTSITDIFKYIGFERSIKMGLYISPSESGINKLLSSVYDEPNIEDELEIIVSFIKNNFGIHKDIDGSHDNFRRNYYYFHDEINFDEISMKSHSLAMALIIKHERKMRRCHLLSRVEFAFYKDSSEVRSNRISSGESSYISSFLFIASHIASKSSIFIDEPENSLHPRWQKDFLNKLLDIFYLFEPNITLATHSPMIVIGGEEQSSSIVIHQAIDRHSEVIPTEKEVNIDEVMVDIFGVLTSRSRYFSYKVNEILNNYMNKKSSFRKTIIQFDKLKSLGPDSRQEKIISGAQRLLEEIGNHE